MLSIQYYGGAIRYKYLGYIVARLLGRQDSCFMITYEIVKNTSTYLNLCPLLFNRHITGCFLLNNGYIWKRFIQVSTKNKLSLCHIHEQKKTNQMYLLFKYIGYFYTNHSCPRNCNIRNCSKCSKF